MTRNPDRWPSWLLLGVGLGLLVIGGVRLARPDGWDGWGGFLVAIGASCAALYVDRALRWLKERP